MVTPGALACSLRAMAQPPTCNIIGKDMRAKAQNGLRKASRMSMVGVRAHGHDRPPLPFPKRLDLGHAAQGARPVVGGEPRQLLLGDVPQARSLKQKSVSPPYWPIRSQAPRSRGVVCSLAPESRQT